MSHTHSVLLLPPDEVQGLDPCSLGGTRGGCLMLIWRVQFVPGISFRQDGLTVSISAHYLPFKHISSMVSTGFDLLKQKCSDFLFLRSLFLNSVNESQFCLKFVFLCVFTKASSV